jgi:radical SAM superfamily enzyme YgiQ (UPF0313 family)
MLSSILLLRSVIKSADATIQQNIVAPFYLKTIQAMLSNEEEANIHFFDSRLDSRPVETILTQIKPEILIIESNQFDLPVVSLLKERTSYRPSYVIFIGQGPTSIPHRYEEIQFGLKQNFIIQGEPEERVQRILQEIATHQSAKIESHLILGKTFENFQMSPPITYTAAELKGYYFNYPIRSKTKLLWGQVMATRGCPHYCTFCTQIVRESYGRNVRKKNLETLKEEFLHLKNLGVNVIAFADDDITSDRTFLLALCEMMITEKFNFLWTAHARVDECDLDLLIKMKESGCTLLRFGIESVDVNVLRYYRKTQSPETWIKKTEEVINQCRKIEIQTLGLFILGSPVDTFLTTFKTTWFILQSRLDLIQLHFFTPYEDTVESKRFKSSNVEHHHYSYRFINYSSQSKISLITFCLLTYSFFYLNPVRFFRLVGVYFPFCINNPVTIKLLMQSFLNIFINPFKEHLRRVKIKDLPTTFS